ncbi:MAG: efflux RND transporter periplasmic adaptor subunit, partial [Xanthomonadales bacterium]|nr:efflux RND transporter periplasmic adaptor subunit [Xanthomonadales bacterium]
SLRFGPQPNRRWRIAITELAQEDSRVQTGDVLARFDGSATDDRIRQLDAELNAKRSELASLKETQSQEIEDGKVRMAAARSAADKAARKASAKAELFASLEYRKLVEDRDITQALYEKEQKRAALVTRVRESKQAELEADIRRLESELSGAQRELEEFTIKAPRAGLVIVGTNRQGQKLDTNEQVNPGMVVVELADENKLVVQAEVPEYAANQIAIGQAVNISIDAAGAGDLAGKVLEVASIVRRQSQYSQAMVRDVAVSLPDSGVEGLRPGMSAKLDIVVDTQRQALAVPDEALQYRDGRPGVLLRGDGWRPVALGRRSAGMTIVESGLVAGDEVSL